MAIKGITSGVKRRPQKIVLYGVEGVGKTLLAAKFPKPLFVDTEGGTYEYPLNRVVPKTWNELMEMVRNADLSDCETLVIDTADWAESLGCASLKSAKGWQSMEDLGYGKCWNMQQEDWRKFLDELTEANSRGLTVVVNCHAQIKTFSAPEYATSYDRWILKLNQKNAHALMEWADAVLFANFETIVEKVGEGVMAKGKARGNKRMLYTQHDACWDAKNRWGLPEKIPLDYEQIKQFVEVPKEDASLDDVPFFDSKEDGEVIPDYWAKANVLLNQAGITHEQIKAMAVSKGFFPDSMDTLSYPKDFVEQVIIGQFDKVKDLVKEL